MEIGKIPLSPWGKEHFAPPLTPDVEGSSKYIQLVVTDPGQILSSSLFIGEETNTTAFSKTRLLMKFYTDLEMLREELASNSKEMAV